MGAAWTLRPDGIDIAVRATPRASRDHFASGTEEYFVARLAAPPVEGAANAALVPLVAKTFGVPRRNVSLIAGGTSRLKRLAIHGDPEALAKIAASLYGREP
jgi:uncharacterized protein (TIGR00251 family)